MLELKLSILTFMVDMETVAHKRLDQYFYKTHSRFMQLNLIFLQILRLSMGLTFH